MINLGGGGPAASNPGPGSTACWLTFHAVAPWVASIEGSAACHSRPPDLSRVVAITGRGRLRACAAAGGGPLPEGRLG
jgi:hypothetical protein